MEPVRRAKPARSSSGAAADPVDPGDPPAVGTAAHDLERSVPADQAASGERPPSEHRAGATTEGNDGVDQTGPQGGAAPHPTPVDDDGALRLLDVEGAPPGTYGELEPDAPPLIDAQGRVRLSFSRIDTYKNCPRKFRYAYIDRLPGVPGPHLSFGSSIHGALEAFYDRKLPEMPSEEALLGFLYDRWDSSGFVELPRDEQLAYYRHAQDVLRRFHRREAPRYRLPATTEEWFELPIGYEAVVVGSIDRVDVDDDGRFHIVDYKTNRKVQNRDRVANSLQLSIYALACRHLYGQLPATVSLDFVVPGVTVTVGIDELDLDRARTVIQQTAQRIRDEAYAPTPNPLCGWCDFRPICPAWPEQGRDQGTSELLGPAVTELRSLRRRVTREVRALRELEAGVERIAAELDADDQQSAVPQTEKNPQGSAAAPATETSSTHTPPDPAADDPQVGAPPHGAPNQGR